MLLQHIDNIFRLFHTAFAHKLTCQFATFGFNDDVAYGAQGLNIVLRDRMAVHVQIHCRRNEHRGLHGKIGGYEHVVGHSACHLAECGSCAWGYQHGIGPLAKFHVAVPYTIAVIEELADNRLSSKS